MKAISVRQPWAWLIIHGGKDFENRDWPTNIRGRVLIHAAKGMTHDEYEDALDTAARAGGRALPPFDALERGGIIGSVEIVDCVKYTEETENLSPWFCGDWGFKLANPVALPFQPLKGMLGFFNVPVVRRLEGSDGG